LLRLRVLLLCLDAGLRRVGLLDAWTWLIG
jgi:hypothetical protein